MHTRSNESSLIYKGRTPVLDPISNESSLIYKGRTIEVYFEETGSVYAWKAFCRCFGTFSGKSDHAAIALAKQSIDAA